MLGGRAMRSTQACACPSQRGVPTVERSLTEKLIGRPPPRHAFVVSVAGETLNPSAVSASAVSFRSSSASSLCGTILNLSCTKSCASEIGSLQRPVVLVLMPDK